MLTKDGIDWCCNGLVQLPIKDIVCCDFKPSSQIEDYTEDQNTNDAESQPVEMVRFKPIDDFGECWAMLIGNERCNFHCSIDGNGNSGVHRDCQKGLEGRQNIGNPVAGVLNFEGLRNVGKSKNHESADQKASENWIFSIKILKT